MTINGNDNHFFGNWKWETDDKKWISWAGSTIADFENHASSIDSHTTDTAPQAGIYTLLGTRVQQPVKGLYIINGKKTIIK
jgi:hypothetical protein